MKNNRGQALVLFVVMLPLLLLIMYAVINIGNMLFIRNELDNVNYMALDYGLDKINEDGLKSKLEQIIRKNNSEIDNVLVDISDNQIKIVLVEKYNLLLINNRDIFKIKSSMVGRIENNRHVIERDKVGGNYGF